MSDRVQKVKHHILQIGHLIEPAINLFGQLSFRFAAVRRRNNIPIQADHRAFALAHLRKDMAVLLLNIDKEFGLRLNITVFRILQNPMERLRSQTFARMLVGSAVFNDIRCLGLFIGRFRCGFTKQRTE